MADYASAYLGGRRLRESKSNELFNRMLQMTQLNQRQQALDAQGNDIGDMKNKYFGELMAGKLSPEGKRFWELQSKLDPGSEKLVKDEMGNVSMQFMPSGYSNMLSMYGGEQQPVAQGSDQITQRLFDAGSKNIPGAVEVEPMQEPSVEGMYGKSPNLVRMSQEYAQSPKGNMEMGNAAIGVQQKELEGDIGVDDDLQKKLNDRDVARVTKMQDSAAAAADARKALEVMSKLSPNLGYTGPGGSAYAMADNILTGMGNFTEAMGFKRIPDLPGDKASRDLFQQEGVDAWLQAVEAMKGSLSDMEGAKLDLAVPGLGTDPAAIRTRADIAEAMEQRTRQKAEFYDKWLVENRTLNGADKAWNEWADKNPVITDDLLGLEQKTPQVRTYNPETGRIE